MFTSIVLSSVFLMPLEKKISMALLKITSDQVSETGNTYVVCTSISVAYFVIVLIEYLHNM